MPAIKVILKSGEELEFDDAIDYSPSVKYEGVFAVIRTRYGATVAIPAAEIARIDQEPPRRGW